MSKIGLDGDEDRGNNKNNDESTKTARTNSNRAVDGNNINTTSESPPQGAAPSTSSKILRENSLVEPIVKNPFVHYLVLSKFDKLKLAIGAVFLAPIRFVSAFIVLLLCIATSYVITAGLKKDDLRDRPLSGWRRKLRGWLRFGGRAIAFCFGFHHIRKIGRRATRTETTLFVGAPHSSFFDAFVFFVLGLPSGVSRAENASLPLLGHLAKACQPILVDRRDAKNKTYTIEEIKRRADPDSDWPQCLIFPEGTTTNRTCLITFKPGAFIPGLPVQPVAVRYLNRMDTITWTWQGLSAAKAMFLTLCQFDNKMEVTYLPVYYPSEAEKTDSKLFAANVRAIMADYLNVATTNHTYEDCRLMLKAAEHNLPFDSALIEFSKLKEKLDIDFENCEKILETYTAFARKSDGKMTLKEFCQYLDLPPSEAVNHVFNLYDRDHDGKIDFREFLIGLSLLSRPASTEDTLRLSFQMFDQDGKGHISLADLKSILFSAFSMPAEEVERLFEKIDSKKDGLITFDEFKSYATQKPEYAKIFAVYHELKILKSNIEIDKLASNKPSSSSSSTTQGADGDGSVKKATTSEATSTLIKRPMSGDKDRVDEILSTNTTTIPNDNDNKGTQSILVGPKKTEIKSE